MVKRLIDYVLDGGIRGHKFSGPNDDYEVLNVLFEEKARQGYVEAEFRSGGKVRMALSDCLNDPETNF